MADMNGTPDDDFIAGTAGGDTINGYDGNDLIQGRGGDDVIYGGSGDDALRGNGGNDQLYGGDGNDNLRGDAGVDYFDGGANTEDANPTSTYGDRVSFYEPDATQGVIADLRTGVISNDGYGNIEMMVGIESLGSDTAFVDTFYGNDGINALFGNRGDNLYGFGGDDQFYLSSAAAIVDGGSGTDLLQLDTSGGWQTADTDGDGIAESVAAATSGWSVNLAAGQMVDGYGNVGSVAGIENVNGSDLADTIDGSGGANIINGNGGDDLIRGRGGDDIISGGSGDDALRGNAGNDQLYGGDGNDNLRGDAGVDYFDGGANTEDPNPTGTYGDRVSFFETDATQGVIADLRTGVISNDGYGNTETMVGIESLGSDTAFVDAFYGNDGINALFGNGGDKLYGFGGDDQFYLASAASIVDGGSGTDVLQVDSSGGWLIPDADGDGIAESVGAAANGWSVDLKAGKIVDGYGNVGSVTGIENVNGSSLADTIRGDSANNVLKGLDGSDAINADRGDDLIYGGAGNDVMTGGQGNDSFVIEAASGNDRIVDFTIGTDKILFDASSGVSSYSQLTFTKSGSDVIVSWGTPDTLLLEGVKAKSLSASDFQFTGSAVVAAAALSPASDLMSQTHLYAHLAHVTDHLL
jgi:Ca2+-binding RTX toxin-like protein